MEQSYRIDSGAQAKSEESGAGAVTDGGGRWDEVAILAAYFQGRDAGKSLAETAREQGIPESTLRHWVGRLDASDGPPAWARFFESPEGLQLLHMIVVAASLVVSQFCGGGVRMVCLFLQLSGLWRFVAAGYGSQCAAIQTMEERIGQFGDLQRQRLAPQMPEKPITLTEDETFHVGKPCLVASEPVSDFLLIEEYADDRRADTWTAKVKQALEGLPVEVVQTTSDGARALVKHAQESLGVHHSPDLFHPQQDISRATSIQLGRTVKAAQKQRSEAEQALESIPTQTDAYAHPPQGPGGVPHHTAGNQQARRAADASTGIRCATGTGCY